MKGFRGSRSVNRTANYPRNGPGEKPLIQSVFISGFGDIARRLARLYLSDSIKVYGLSRNLTKNQSLGPDGVDWIEGDLDMPLNLRVPPVDVIFHLAPPPPSGQTDPRCQNLLGCIKQAPKRLVLLSTTAVYGDCQGDWIDEQQPTDPQTDRGLRRLRAEQAVRDWCQENKVPWVILRVGGIYGPERLPRGRLEKGIAVLQEDQSPYTNRIHEDDLAQICYQAASHGPDNEIYNVSDGHPGTMTQYFKDIARALHLPSPPEIDREEANRQLSAGMLSYLKESRRINNEKMLQQLDVSLRYPTLADGLAVLEK